MWNRQQVKEQAKIIMKRNYWKMFVVTLLAGLLTGEKTTIIERVQNLRQPTYLTILHLYFIHLISNIYFIHSFQSQVF